MKKNRKEIHIFKPIIICTNFNTLLKSEARKVVDSLLQ